MVKWSYDDKRTRELPRCLLVRSNATELFVNHHRYVPGLCGDVLRRTESTTVQDDEPCLSALVGRLRSSGNRAFIGVEASKARVISHPPKHSEVLRTSRIVIRRPISIIRTCVRGQSVRWWEETATVGIEFLFQKGSGLGWRSPAGM